MYHSCLERDDEFRTLVQCLTSMLDACYKRQCMCSWSGQTGQRFYKWRSDYVEAIVAIVPDYVIQCSLQIHEGCCDGKLWGSMTPDFHRYTIRFPTSQYATMRHGGFKGRQFRFRHGSISSNCRPWGPVFGVRSGRVCKLQIIDKHLASLVNTC